MNEKNQKTIVVLLIIAGVVVFVAVALIKAFAKSELSAKMKKVSDARNNKKEVEDEEEEVTREN